MVIQPAQSTPNTGVPVTLVHTLPTSEPSYDEPNHLELCNYKPDRGRTRGPDSRYRWSRATDNPRWWWFFSQTLRRFHVRNAKA